MTVFYIDVSHHDRDRRGSALDWGRIFDYTAPVMVARATYGDPAGYSPNTRYHAEFHSGAKAAGAQARGSYHNLIAGDAASINRQVDWLRREMDTVGAHFAMVDVERYPELVSNGLWPRWNDVQQFAARWHQVDDRVCLAYIPGWLYDGFYAPGDLKALGLPLVESDYGSKPGGLPAAAYSTRGGDGGRGWNSTGNLAPTVWQFTSEGDLPGASGQTDYNAFKGTTGQLVAFLTGWKDDHMERSEFLGHFKAALLDPGIAPLMRAIGWQYVGGGIPDGMSTLGVVNETLARVRGLGDIIARESTNPAEVAAALAALETSVAEAAQVGAASAATSLASAVVDAVKTAAGDRLTDSDLARVEDAVRDALTGATLQPRPDAG